MARWYSTVVDCRDVSGQAQLVGSGAGLEEGVGSDDEVVLVPQHATLELLQTLSWEQVPPGLVSVPVRRGEGGKESPALGLGFTYHR